MRKKLLINALSAQDGGGITYLTNMLPLFDKEKFKISLLINSGNEAIVKDLNLQNINVLFISKTENIWFRLVWEALFIKRIIRKHNISHYYCPGGIMVPFKFKKVETIVAFRNMMPFYSEVFKYYNIKEKIRLHLLKKFSLYSFKGADKVIFISKYAKEVIKTYLPDIDRKSEVIYHGKNNLFKPDKNKAESLVPEILEQPYIIYVSTLTVYKHQFELIEAYSQLIREGNKLKKILLVGGIGSAFGAELLNKIKLLKLEKDIVYVGKVDYSKLPVYYKNADSVIYASSCENCPNILIESMAMGKLIYSSNYQPMPEFGKDSLQYFNPKSISDFKKVIKLESKRTHNKALNNKAIEIINKLNWDNTYKKTKNFIFK